MKAIFSPCKLNGIIKAPPSKSMAHRYLIGAALARNTSMLSGMDYSEDILATIDCLKSLGCKISIQDDKAIIDSRNFMNIENPILECRESGSTLRFFIPLALCLGTKVIFKGSERLFERPLEIYKNICDEKGFLFQKEKNSLIVCGNLKSEDIKIPGHISSQFITGLIFALIYLNENSTIEILPPFESRSYINLTISSLKAFGVDIFFSDEYKISIKKSNLNSFSGSIEGDYSNAAFLDSFNYIGSQVKVENLKEDSLQGDKIYKEYFSKISEGSPTLDISDCPDLGPILFALSALKNGASFTGTDRLKIKESDRGSAMAQELRKLGGSLIIGNNNITVSKQNLFYQNIELDSHNDHRIVMALSVILSVTGGTINNVQAVKKSYPRFFEDIKKLGAKVELI